MIEIEPITGLKSDDGRCALIAGPCSAESEQQVIQCARMLSGMGIGTLRAGIWKPRTRPGGYEGPGRPGLEWLRKARQLTGMRIMTEVANAAHVEAALEAGIDMVWIGARTTVSPFAVQEIADSLAGTGIPVFVKNPINADIDLWTGAFERLSRAGIRHLAAIHRGFSSYGETVYRYAPQWEIPIELRRRIPQLPIFCDPSHMAGRTGLIQPLAQTAMDLNADGLFVEVHPDPSCALSDRNQQLTPDEFGQLVRSLSQRRETSEYDRESLKPLRDELDSVDKELIGLLARRFGIAREIGSYKQLHNLAVLQPDRYNAVMENIIREAVQMGIDGKCISNIFENIHSESIRWQLETINRK